MWLTTKPIWEGGEYPPSLEDFHNLHKGETVVLLGNGPSLNEAPIGLLGEFPTIGMNTIHKSRFIPHYYVTVDSRVMREFGWYINRRYRNVPKFLPRPNLDKWEGEHIYRWYHRPGVLWPHAEVPLWPSNLLSDTGITYACVMHAAMQIAYFMGFTTMLLIGVDHTLDSKAHFWGPDEGMGNGRPDLEGWAEGYKQLREGMGVEMYNLSSYTELGDQFVPRKDWRYFMPRGAFPRGRGR